MINDYEENLFKINYVCNRVLKVDSMNGDQIF